MKKHNSIAVIFFIVFVSIYISIVIHIYITSEKYFYSWDFQYYFEQWCNFTAIIKKSTKEAFLSLLETLKILDYNLLPISFISFVGVVFEISREIYIQSVGIYLIILSFIYYICFKNFTNDSYFKYILFIIPVTFTPFLSTALRGCPDISGLIFILLSIIICNKIDFSKKTHIFYSFVVGAVFWCSFALRRWYIYTIITLFFTLPIYNYLNFNKKIMIKSTIYILINCIISGCTILLLLYFLQYDLVVRIISTNYKHIYSAYNNGLLFSICQFLNSIGYLYFCIYVIGVVYLFVFGKHSEKNYVILSLSSLIISFIFFTSTQSPDLHHMIVFTFWVLSLNTLLCIAIYNKIIKLKNKIIFSISIIAFLFSCQYYCLFNEQIEQTCILQKKYLPLKIKHYDEYKRLIDDVFSVVDDKIVVFSSSWLLNDNMLASAFNQKLLKKIVTTSHVDLRDHINFEVYLAKYAIVTSKPALHLNKMYQQLISIPNNLIYNSISIGKAYEKIYGPYKLDNDIEAFIFKKTRAFSKEEIEELLLIFYTLYPEFKKDNNQKDLRLYLSKY